MRKWIYIFGWVLLFSCDNDNGNDCFQTAGNIIEEEFVVDDFQSILVNRDIELIVKQGPIQQVVIQTGENLINDVTAEVIDNRLILTDDNTCNYVRDFGITKVFVTTPNITEIRCSTQFEIKSDGVLQFENLRLLSENFNTPDSFPIGDFRLNLDVENLQVISNNLSFFYLSGQAENLNVNFAAGNGRFEGENLIAQDVTITHRGSNDILINPQLSVSGSILSTGNVISYNLPSVVDVEEVFNGRLIFID